MTRGPYEHHADRTGYTGVVAAHSYGRVEQGDRRLFSARHHDDLSGPATKQDLPEACLGPEVKAHLTLYIYRCWCIMPPRLLSSEIVSRSGARMRSHFHNHTRVQEGYIRPRGDAGLSVYLICGVTHTASLLLVSSPFLFILTITLVTWSSCAAHSTNATRTVREAPLQKSLAGNKCYRAGERITELDCQGEKGRAGNNRQSKKTNK